MWCNCWSGSENCRGILRSMGNRTEVRRKTMAAQAKIATICDCQEERPGTAICLSPSSIAAATSAMAAQRNARSKGYGLDIISSEGKGGQGYPEDRKSVV